MPPKQNLNYATAWVQTWPLVGLTHGFDMSWFQNKTGAKSESETLVAAEQYSLLKADGVEAVFPNVEVALRICLSLMVSNCSGERSFSRLKFLKIPNRSSMSQDKRNCFALMSIEPDILQQIYFADVITASASLKSRKTPV